MKTINIDGKEFELNFGIRFSRTLSKVYVMEREVEGNKIKFGLGVRMVVGYLEAGDEDAIFQTIKAALSKHKKLPSDDAIEDALDELAMEMEGFDAIAQDLLAEMKDTGFYKSAFEGMDETAAKKDQAETEK